MPEPQRSPDVQEKTTEEIWERFHALFGKNQDEEEPTLGRLSIEPRPDSDSNPE